MKTRIFTVLFIVSIFLLPSALAANSQGLTWGVQENQEIQYNLRVSMSVESTITTMTINELEQVKYKIMVLPDIPDTITSISQIPYVTGTMTYLNDSSITPPPMSVPVSNLIMPIGNWALIDQLMKESAEYSPLNLTWIDNFSNWGYSYKMEITYPIEAEMTLTVQFSKADGAASLISVSYDYDTLGSGEVSFTRIGGPLDTTTILLIVGGIGAVLIVGVVFWKLRR